jgi:hypothetical protein
LGGAPYPLPSLLPANGPGLGRTLTLPPACSPRIPPHFMEPRTGLC